MTPFLKHGAKIKLIPSPDWDWVGWDGEMPVSAPDHTLKIGSVHTILDRHVPGFKFDFLPRQYTSKAYCDIPGMMEELNFTVDMPTLSKLMHINGASPLLHTSTGEFTGIISNPAQKIIPTGTTQDTVLRKKGKWKVVDTNQQVFHESKHSPKDANQISPETFHKIGERLGVEPAVIHAITDVEASGSGFDKNGRVKIRFEGHKFKDCLKKKGVDVDKLTKEGNDDVIYDYKDQKQKTHDSSAYDKAVGIDEECAKSSSSFGAFQIMGFNYKDAGYKSVDDFVDAQNTVDGQTETFANFVSKSPAKMKAMQDKDFATFAKLYNGPDYADHNYDGKMEDAYAKYKPPPTLP